MWSWTARGYDGPVPTYVNPVWPGYFADPFVLRVGDDYYAYGTGNPSDRLGGREFEVLHSRDLVSWSSVGGALEPLPDPALTDYWAPEVAEHDGRFWMYYSAGTGDVGQRLRVAVADSPQGPFHDCEVQLTPDEPFSIDAHPFRDADGSWYLFYAVDRLDGDRVGTGIVVDRLVDMTHLAGTPTPVVQPSADWQIFKRDREMYGQVYDWHTCEGPFVVPHEGRYYCLYSGGPWEAETYGVSYVVGDAPTGPWQAPPVDGPVVLTTVPGQVVGPGHNSVVRGPDGREWVVYHAWDTDLTARRLCIDPLEWTPDGPRCAGPSTDPQPAPSP